MILQILIIATLGFMIYAAIEDYKSYSFQTFFAKALVVLWQPYLIYQAVNNERIIRYLIVMTALILLCLTQKVLSKRLWGSGDDKLLILAISMILGLFEPSMDILIFMISCYLLVTMLSALLIDHGRYFIQKTKGIALAPGFLVAAMFLIVLY